MRIVIEAGFVGTALGNCFRAFHHHRVAKSADLAGGLGFDGKFALRVVRAGIKNPEAAAALDSVSVFAFRTRHITGFRFIGMHNKMTMRVMATANKHTVAAIFHSQLVSTFWTKLVI